MQRPFFCLVLSCILLAGSSCRLYGSEPSDAIEWDFEQADIAAEAIGAVEVTSSGPTSEHFLGLPDANQAIEFRKAGAHLRIADDSDGRFDFGGGDAITLEAWVRIASIKSGANIYIVGKGRTYESSRQENQNYALRLLGSNRAARLSFLFSTRTDDGAMQYHRWNSDQAFAADNVWHHVAIGYRFGEPQSICGYVDGKTTSGKWDMAGATTAPPVVDNDSVWIGSSRGGDPANSLVGGLDQIRIHRRIVSAQEIGSRRIVEERSPSWPATADADRVTLTLHESAGSYAAFPSIAPEETFRFSTTCMAIPRLPLKYLPGGIRDTWDGPVLMRAYTKATLPAGEVEFLVRCPGLSRLWVDGKVIVTTPPHRLKLDAHQPFDVYERDLPWLRVPRSGVHEQRAKIGVADGVHEVVLESLVGSDTTRCEPNETIVALRQRDAMFTVLSPSSLNSAPLHLVDDEFEDYRRQFESELSRLDRQLLVEYSQQEDAFWEQRHVVARAVIASQPELELPISRGDAFENNVIDRFINADLTNSQLSEIDRPISDREFLRRISLDTIGVPPSLNNLRIFERDGELRRQRAIEQLLSDDRWADHWTSYWQDVLAENPNILKPSLNNSGPFRLWIHDSLLLNKPLDRFVTELIRMEGSAHAGAPKGFEMASQNDVPMAEKAHVIASTFLAVDMKCARCHDAPYHPWKQEDLFSIGAMLKKAAIEVPLTSSVPVAFFDRRGDESPIEVTLRPGAIVQPKWPEDLLPAEEFGPSMVADELLGRDATPREQLAAMITRAENRRFAKTIVNRVWQRLMGWGLVSESDDWYDANVRNAGLLDFLARELVTSGYDLKHVTGMILESRVYNRRAINAKEYERELQFAAPWQRRLSAEQLVDSIHQVTGVAMETEEITFDPEGAQQQQNFLNLGVADRAWKLASLSNERDRPSLNLPKAAAVVECLEAFGWRSSRQSPTTHRETEPNLVQPGVLANGHLTGWASRMTDNSQMTQLALEAESAAELVGQLFAAVLTREPTENELAVFEEQLREGFDQRLQLVALTEKSPPPNRGFATWTNHFTVEANELVRELERETAAGPTPTERLTADWRERAEDAIWSLLNSPEFQMIP